MAPFIPTRIGPAGIAAGLAALIFWSAALSGAAAAASGKAAELKARQDEVRGRLDTLRQNLAKSEESRSAAADQLRATESAISDANRNLRRLTDQRAEVEAQARELESQSRRLAEQTEAQQRQLSRLLHRRYTRGDGEADAFAMLLAGRDPNQAALDYQFLKRLSLAKAELIADLRAKAGEKKRLTAAAREKGEELSAIERKQQQTRAGLLDQQKQRQAILAGVAGEIKAQRREIGALQRDEQRLGQLLKDLSRRAAKRPPPPSPPPRLATEDSRQPAPPAVHRQAPESAPDGGAFAALRGRLSLPVRGEIAGRFGRPRPEGGTTWKGLFIRAAEGTDVKAVAAGQVVYAEWLRGFGNLLVVDHGDGYLSVYGNNQSLLKENGQNVRAGEAVATVGNSGGNAQSGLYFELRHLGQAFDPLGWVNPR